MSPLRIGDLAIIISCGVPSYIGRTVQVEALFTEGHELVAYDNDVFQTRGPVPHAGVVLCKGLFDKNSTVSGKPLLPSKRSVFRCSSLQRISPDQMRAEQGQYQELSL